MKTSCIALVVLSVTSTSIQVTAAHIPTYEDSVQDDLARDIQSMQPRTADVLEARAVTQSKSSTGKSTTLIKTSTSTARTSSTSTSTARTSSTSSQRPCPTVWTKVAADLRADYGGCSQDATDAVRFAFHDSSGYSALTKPYGPASGGADGSILLNDEEGSRSASDPMQGYRSYLLDVYNQYKSQGVGAADLVQFAGNLGVASCSGGPVLRTVVGRIDDATAAPAGLIPEAFGAGAAYDVLIKLFADKGFSPRELAALMGAHSVSHAFEQTSNGIPNDGPQDSTPDTWDMLYYSQTQAKVAPDGVYRFDSDIHLANASTTAGKAYTEFANSRDAWVVAFSAAMYKLSILGIPSAKVNNFTDCTAVIKGSA